MLKIGRGWACFDYPVSLEPVFQIVAGEFRIENESVIDDGRHPGFFQKMFSRSTNHPQTALSNSPSPSQQLPVDKKPQKALISPTTELQINLPQTTIVTPEITERLLSALANRVAPTALEIIGTEESTIVQIAVLKNEVEQSEKHVRAYFPESITAKTENHLANLFSVRKRRRQSLSCY